MFKDIYIYKPSVWHPCPLNGVLDELCKRHHVVAIWFRGLQVKDLLNEPLSNVMELIDFLTMNPKYNSEVAFFYTNEPVDMDN